jgi:hypothetical protein
MNVRILTAAIATSVCVLGFGSAPGQATAPPQSRPPHPSGTPVTGQAMDETVVQGCLSRGASADPTSGPATFLLKRTDTSPDAGSPPAASKVGGAAPGAPAQGPAGQKNAHAEAMQGTRGATPSHADTDGTYRVTPASPAVNLEAHIGHRVELRGHLAGTDTDAAANRPERGGSQAVQGGQMQGVGQTMQSGQGGQSGQSTQAPVTDQPGRPLPPADGPAVAYRTLTVTSVRMLDASCGTSR